ncbi:hypothetical protein Nepgr_027517 [Nepenthes gracilis]|uniref:Uncharacterized protein n=1 Tax=Nepenthes gracilis TaxID=150966 RepID=A0AAD3TAH3_NEPGR|nr:hypothetical protein Nepgr_027517 [Nepenthes gracilis]
MPQNWMWKGLHRAPKKASVAPFGTSSTMATTSSALRSPAEWTSSMVASKRPITTSRSAAEKLTSPASAGPADALATSYAGSLAIGTVGSSAIGPAGTTDKLEGGSPTKGTQAPTHVESASKSIMGAFTQDCSLIPSCARPCKSPRQWKTRRKAESV